MRHVFQIAGASIAGLFLGAMGMSVLHAQTATAPAYLVSNIAEVKDPELMKKYSAGAPATVAAFGGKVIARATPVMLDDRGATTGTVFLIQFPSMKNLTDWFHSPGYSAVRPFRENASTGRLYAIEGLPPS